MRRRGLSLSVELVASWTLAVGLCSAGSLGEDGDVYVLDSEGGPGSSLVLRADGRPLISYASRDNSELRVFDCADENCSTGQSYLLATGEIDSSTAIAIRKSGLPIIAYSDNAIAVDSLAAIDCDAGNCSSGTIRNFKTDDGGGTLDMVISEAGNPLIVYGALGGFELLKLLSCSDDRCAQAILRVLDPVDFSGGHTSIILRRGGLPIIAYGGVNRALNIYDCTDSECSTGRSSVLDDQSEVGMVDMALGDDGFPIISYHDKTQEVLKVYACGATDCNTGTVQDALEAVATGLSSSITIGADGTPLVGYSDTSKNHLKVLDCSGSTCTGGEIYVLDRAVSNRSGRSSLTVRNSGLPIITYQDDITNQLRVYSCANNRCRLPGYSIAKAVIPGGGGASRGKKLSLKGSIGQPVTQSSTDSNYTLSGGFWSAGDNTDLIFRSGFEQSGGTP